MNEIPLTKGFVAVVDDEDFERINALKWYALVAGRTVYGTRKVKAGHFMMHRVIMGVTDPKIHIDHRDHNGLHNWRTNLRISNSVQNHQNMRKTEKKRSSIYKGVSFYKRDSNWRAYIKINQKTIWLGYYKTEDAGARAYDAKARELFGEFSNCNFPE